MISFKCLHELAVAAKGGAKFLPEPVNFRFPHTHHKLYSATYKMDTKCKVKIEYILGAIECHIMLMLLATSLEDL